MKVRLLKHFTHFKCRTSQVRIGNSTLKDELHWDFFVSRMRNSTFQDTLALETLTPEEESKRDIKSPKSSKTTLVFSKTKKVAETAEAQKKSSSGIKTKQEPKVADSTWMEEAVGVQIALKQKTCHLKKCHIMDVVVPSQIDSSKFAQQKLQKRIHIAKTCWSQQVNETVESFDSRLENEYISYPLSRALSNQYLVLLISEFFRRSHSQHDSK